MSDRHGDDQLARFLGLVDGDEASVGLDPRQHAWQARRAREPDELLMNERGGYRPAQAGYVAKESMGERIGAPPGIVVEPAFMRQRLEDVVAVALRDAETDGDIVQRGPIRRSAVDMADDGQRLGHGRHPVRANQLIRPDIGRSAEGIWH